MSDNNRISERLARVEQIATMNTDDIKQQQEKIDNISDQLQLMNRMNAVIELQLDSVKNQDRVVRALEKTTNNLENTVNNITDIVKNLNDNQKSFSIKQNELETKVNKVVENSNTEKPGTFNWIDFMTKKFIPTLCLAVLMYFIYLVTGIKF